MIQPQGLQRQDHSLKMAKTLTGNSRRRDQQIQSLMLNRLSQKYERQLSREIARAMQAGATAVRTGRNIQSIQADHERRITPILQSLWIDTGTQMAEHILGSERSRNLLMEQKQDFDVSATEVIDRVMTGWMAQVGGEKIKQITRTTLTDIRNIVNRGIADGLSEREIGAQIAAVAPTKSASRAQTIARTETHSASTFAAQSSAEATGLSLVKVWTSARGERTRPDHDEADGQRRALNEPFIVGGELLMYPADPVGSPEQVINCRCVIAYEMAD